MNNEKDTREEQQQSAPGTQKAWTAPILVEYGDVETLTSGGSMQGSDMNACFRCELPPGFAS